MWRYKKLLAKGREGNFPNFKKYLIHFDCYNESD